MAKPAQVDAPVEDEAEESLQLSYTWSGDGLPLFCPPSGTELRDVAAAIREMGFTEYYLIGTYYEDTPQNALDEMRAILASMTFGG